jgi:hypothetical protein
MCGYAKLLNDYSMLTGVWRAVYPLLLMVGQPMLIANDKIVLTVQLLVWLIFSWWGAPNSNCLLTSISLAAAAGLNRLMQPAFRHLFSGLLCTIDLRNDR